MSVFTLSTLSGVVPSLYGEISNEIQRSTVLLRLLPFKRCTTGASAQWIVKGSGASASAVSLDNGSVVAAANNARYAASLALGEYATASQISEKMKWLGANIESNPNFLADLMDQGIQENIQAMAKTLNAELYTGSGSGSAMTGLQAAAQTSGTYASLATSTLSAWAATVDGYQASPQAFTLAALRKTLSDVTIASGRRPDLCVTHPTVMNSILAAFESKSTVFYSGQDAMQTVQSVRTAAGTIDASGFRAIKWTNENVIIVEDPDFQLPLLDATHPQNHILVMNTGSVDVQYLDPRPAQAALAPAMVRPLETQDFGQFDKLPIKVKLRANGSTYSDIVDMLTICGVRVKDRNALGICASVN